MFDSSASNGQYMKVSAIARTLGISSPTVRELVRAGKLSGIQIEGLVLVERASFERFMQNATVRPMTAKAA